MLMKPIIRLLDWSPNGLWDSCGGHPSRTPLCLFALPLPLVPCPARRGSEPWRVTNYRLPVTNRQSQLANHQSQVTDYQSLTPPISTHLTSISSNRSFPSKTVYAPTTTCHCCRTGAARISKGLRVQM